MGGDLKSKVTILFINTMLVVTSLDFMIWQHESKERYALFFARK
jgi:hypothetical protein